MKYIKTLLRLSSTLTLLYRWVFPVLIVSANILMLVWMMFILPPQDWQFYALFVPFVMGLSFFVCSILVKLKIVYVDNDQVMISDGIQKFVIPLSSVVGVQRFVFYFFRIDYKDDRSSKSLIVLPRLSEFIFSLGLKIKSFERFIALIGKSREQSDF